MPIADILGHREAVYQISLVGNELNVDKAHYYDEGLTFGIRDIAEVGYDNDFRGNTALNAKVQLYHTPNASKFALSLGMQNIGLLGAQPDKYLVARYDLKAFRIHAGYIYNDRSRLMLGLDAPLPRACCLNVDYMSGPGSYLWTGLCLPVPIKGLQIMLSGGIPMDHRNGVQHQFYVSYGFKL
jgi:hypothetical protein